MNSQKMIAPSSFTSLNYSSARQMGVYQQVTVGCVTEVTPLETRVALTPATCREFISNGHLVVLQSGAGISSGFSDELYLQAGVSLLQSPQEVYQKSHVLLKVMQPRVEEYSLIQANQIIFCFLDYTNEKSFFEQMLQQKAIVINYQSLQNEMNVFPVMNVMSEIDGFLAIQQGMKLMESNMMTGYGKLLGQVSNVEAAQVLILGGGVAAVKAATLACSIGAHVTLMDICSENLRAISNQLPSSVNTMFYTVESMEQLLPSVDLLIGAALPAFNRAPLLVSEKQMLMLHSGAVVVDLAMSQGQNFATSRLTTFEKPSFLWNNIMHFCYNNISLYTPYTSSLALSHVVLPYALQVSNMGWKRASLQSFELRQSLAMISGFLTNFQFHLQTNIPFTPLENLLEQEINAASKLEGMNSAAITLKQQLANINSNGNNSSSYIIEA